MAKRRQPIQPLPDSPPDSFPLTDEHATLMRAVQQSCGACARVIDKMERAGYDVSSYRAVNDGQLAKATGVLAEFFPDQT